VLYRLDAGVLPECLWFFEAAARCFILPSLCASSQTIHLSFRLGGSIILIMHEVLSRTDGSKMPLRDQVYYELRFFDSESAGEPVCCVRQARASWNEESQAMAWDEVSVEAFATLKEAEERYAERRFALTQMGFTDSDLDLL
jgi:hypothetical protein